MRVEPVVALIASAALHAGVLMYVPGAFDSREPRVPEAATPGVVVAPACDSRNGVCGRRCG